MLVLFIPTILTTTTYPGTYVKTSKQQNIIIRRLLDRQEGSGVPVLARPVLADPGPQRELKKYQGFSEAGKTAWNRAMSELELRLHKTPITANEVAAMYGDVRLAKGAGKLLKTAKNLDLLPTDDYGSTITEQIILKFEHYYKQHAALKASLALQVGMVAPVADADDDDDLSSDDDLLDEAPVSAALQAAAAAAKKPSAILKRFFSMIKEHSKRIKWQEWLPAHAQQEIMNPNGTPKDEEDITEMDLMTVNIGPFYCDLVSNAAQEVKEEIALAVSFIMARMGDNMAESWCERQIHVCNQIMTCDRTRMGSDLLEWLAVLRMNRAWMSKRMKIFAGLLSHLDLRATEGYMVLN